MEQITSLSERIQSNFSNLASISLVQGDVFSWNPQTKTITYVSTDEALESSLLHEYGHALLGHTDYSYDIDLLKMERAAWDQALRIAKQIDLTIDSDNIEDHLDTYRDWLHARSLCPRCSSTGLQVATHQYTCPACSHAWTVNDARTCALRRYNTKKRP